MARHMSDTVKEANLEAIRQTEHYLEAQLTVASSSDQRGINFCALLILVLTVLLVTAFSKPNNIVLLVSLIAFAVAAALSAFSARPVRFYVGGGSYAGFVPYLNETYAHLLWQEIGKRNDDFIRSNDRAIKRNSKLFRAALFVAAAAGVMLFIGLAKEANFLSTHVKVEEAK
jgi:hypothetical protein